MAAIAAIAALLAAIGALSANIAFIQKKRRQAWIPPMLMAAWIGLWCLAAAIHLALRNFVMATICGAAAATAVIASTKHESDRIHDADA